MRRAESLTDGLSDANSEEFPFPEDHERPQSAQSFREARQLLSRSSRSSRFSPLTRATSSATSTSNSSIATNFSTISDHSILSSSTFDSSIWDEDLHDVENLKLNGVSNKNYGQNVQAAVILYKNNTLRKPLENVQVPFLRRNWMGRFGTFVNGRTRLSSLPPRGTRQKKIGLELLINTIKSKETIEEELKERQDFTDKLSIAQLATYTYLRDHAFGDLHTFLRSPSQWKVPMDFMMLFTIEKMFTPIWNLYPIILTIESFRNKMYDVGLGHFYASTTSFEVKAFAVFEYGPFLTLPVPHMGQLGRVYDEEAIEVPDNQTWVNDKEGEPINIELSPLINKAKAKFAKRVFIVLQISSTYNDTSTPVVTFTKKEFYTVLNVWQKGDHHTGVHFTVNTEQQLYVLPKSESDEFLYPFQLVEHEEKIKANHHMFFSIQSKEVGMRVGMKFVERYVFDPLPGKYAEKIDRIEYDAKKFPRKRHEAHSQQTFEELNPYYMRDPPITVKQEVNPVTGEITTIEVPGEKTRAVPQTKYRFYQGVVICDSERGDLSSPLALTTSSTANTGKEEPKTHIGLRMNITTEDHPYRCFICRQIFKNFHQLMVHCNVMYPRLQFVYNKEDSTPDCYMIDVILNPDFRDIDEVRRRCKNTGDVEVMVHRQVIDTYQEIVKDPENTHLLSLDTSHVFLDHLLYRREEAEDVEVYYKQFNLPKDLSDPNSFLPIPMPSSERLIAKSRKRIFDFADVSYPCKVFMFTWNSMIFKIGRDRSLQIGEYSLFKLYIHLHRPLFEKIEKLEGVVETAIHHGNHILLHQNNMELCKMDLLGWLKSKDYNPRVIDDNKYTLPILATKQFLVEFHDDYLQNKDKPDFVFHELASKDMTGKSNTELYDVIQQLLKTNWISGKHEVRLLWEKPEDVLAPFRFCTIPKIMFEWPPFPEMANSENGDVNVMGYESTNSFAY